MTEAAEPFHLSDAYYDIGRVVVIAATLERTILGWRVKLSGGDEQAWKKAEADTISGHIEVCIEKVRKLEMPTEAKAEAIRRLEWVKGLFDTRHHLVHGLPPRYEPGGTILWLKRDRKKDGNVWTERDLDRKALKDFANDLAFADSVVTGALPGVL
jgi:hypothetical protein